MRNIVELVTGSFIIIWIISVIASLAFGAAVIYIAWHFISKFW